MTNFKNYCPYFEYRIENFGILLKGKSLELFSDYSDCFDKCFIVSDYEYELPLIGKYLHGKDIVHFTNRYHQSSLKCKTYKEYKIRHLQLGQSFRINHYRLMRTFIYHKIINRGLKVHLLPDVLNSFDKNLPEEYSLKFPNTGLLSIVYALKIIQPKNLWIFGMDFYSKDYLAKQQEGYYSQSRSSPDKNILFNSEKRLAKQKYKSDRLDLDGLFSRLVDEHQNTNVKIGTYFDGLKSMPNLEHLKNEN